MKFTPIEEGDVPKKTLSFKPLEEDISTPYAAIPGQEQEPDQKKARYQEYLAQQQRQIDAAGGKLNYGLAGVGEAGLNFLSQIPAQAVGVGGLGLHAAGKALGIYDKNENSTQAASDLANKFIYEPRTNVGKQYSEAAGELVNRYLMPFGPGGQVTGLSKLQRQAMQVENLRLSAIPGAKPVPLKFRPIPEANDLNTVAGRLAAAKEAVKPPTSFQDPLDVSHAFFDDAHMPLNDKTGALEKAPGIDRPLNPYNPENAKWAMDENGMPVSQEVGRMPNKPVNEPINPINVTAEGQGIVPHDIATQMAMDRIPEMQRQAFEEAQRKFLSEGENSRSNTDPRRQMTDSGINGNPLRPERAPIGLSTGEAAIGNGKDITRPMVNDSGLMGLPETKPTIDPGLYLGEQSSSVKDPNRAMNSSNVMGESLPNPVGLSTGEGAVGVGRKNGTQGPSNVMGVSSPKYDPFGSLGNMGRSQRGTIDPNLLTLGLRPLAQRLHETFVKRGEEAKVSVEPTREDFVKNLPGMGKTGMDILTKGPSGEEMIQRVMEAGNKDSTLAQDFQSGLGHAGEKTSNPMLSDIARHLRYVQNYAQKAIRDFAQPLEKAFISIKNEGQQALMNVFHEEQFGQHEFPDDTLRKIYGNDKLFEAHKQLRMEQERALNAQNDARALVGLEPVTKRDGYMASRFNGEFHVVVRNKEGTVLWYAQNPTRYHANSAVKWLKENLKDHPDIDINSIKTEFEPNRQFGNVPRDIVGAYHDMLKFIGDDPAAQAVVKSLEHYLEVSGTRVSRQDLHQVNIKTNVRGAEGDKPWLSANKNADAWAKSQIKYLENAHKWAAMQTAMAEIKKVMSDKAIIDAQPNNIALAKAYLLNHMGVSKNVFKEPMRYFADLTGLPTNSFASFTNMLKGATYAGLLAWSPGYILATPMQAVAGTTGWLQKLTRDKYISPEASAKFLEGMGVGSYSGLFFTDKGLNPAYKEMFNWGTENGVMQKSIVDELSDLSTNRALRAGKQVFNYTISRPDQLTRAPLFMSFGKALEEGGRFESKELAWQRASEITDHIMTNMRRTERPLIVDKLGALGDVGYLFKAPTMAFYNTISMFIHNKNFLGLTALLLAHTAMSGVMNFPIVSELDGLLNVYKDWMSHVSPTEYARVRDISIRETIMRLGDQGTTFNQVMNYGTPSAVTGINFATRFNQSFLDVEHPLAGVTPLGQELGEWIGASKALLHPTQTTAAEAMYAFAPPLGKGLLETMHPSFKALSPEREGGVTAYRNPHNLENTDMFVARTPEETNIRKLGMMAVSEADRRNKDFMSNARDRRDKQAITTLQSDLWDSINRDDVKDTAKYISTYRKLDPSLSTLNSYINDRVGKGSMTPNEWRQAHINTLRDAQSVSRRLEMDR